MTVQELIEDHFGLEIDVQGDSDRAVMALTVEIDDDCDADGNLTPEEVRMDHHRGKAIISAS